MSYELFKNLIPIFIGLFLLYIMYNILFVLQLGSYNNTSGSIIFAKPFEAWTHVAPGWYVPITFIHSFALPILYMTFYGKELIKNKLLLYSLALTILGLLISIFIIEDGPRKFHGNFMWQNIICSYILIMVVVCDLVKKIIKEKLNSAKLKILFGLLFLHTVSGIIYIIKIFVSKSYF
ncbi:MAG: hypothetical protein KAS62_00035 [Candidatus Delongbacteria bacterium]|nr:hypothetical protein [Candidatus Delongbacteria bacterium]